METVIDDSIVSTRDLQLFSVAQAMKTLGYRLCRTERGGYIFYNPSNAYRGDALMGMQRAFTLHNYLHDWCSMGYDAYTVRQFLAAKIVHSVKLQYDKRKKMVYVNGCKYANYVAFVDNSYPTIFGIVNE